MRLGIDCRAMQGKGGIATYAFHLVKNLLITDKRNHYVLFFDPQISQNLKNLSEQKNCSIKYFSHRGLLDSLPFVRSHILFSRFLKKQGLDIFHAPAGSLPLFYKGKTVVTAHDMAIYKNPEWFPRFQFFSKNIVVPRSLRKATYIIAVSESTKRDLLTLFSIPSKKIQVIYEGGLDASLISSGKQESALDYILTISTLEPRKNLVRLIRAFTLYRRHNPQKREKLIIIGGEGWKYKGIYKEIRELGAQKEAILAGYVGEKEKIRLLRRAKAFIFPSLYEGFGLPVVEAMSLGVPVICSRRGALAEICGNAAFFVNPYAVQSIAEGLSKVLGDRDIREKLAKKGLERAQRFSWQKCAKETLEVYQNIH
ncbi:MAG: glycosyltransferase family 1 protein [Patescibacteria group bacterium]|nr:glycosyltransferase family 1 protein [Patescibacteria group bacterium]